MDRSWGFPVLLAVSMALHGFILLTAPHTRPPRLYVHQGRFSVALRAIAPTAPDSVAVEKVTSAPAASPRKPIAKAEPLEKAAVDSRAHLQPDSQARARQPVIADSGAVDVVPAPWSDNPAPAYPERARRDGEQGVVTLRLRVLADGGVGSVVTVASSGYALLDEAARRVAAEYRFEPARRAGQPVDYDVIVPFEFRLRRARWASKTLPARQRP